jgi:cysteinyl-tRNA synthetase
LPRNGQTLEGYSPNRHSAKNTTTSVAKRPFVLLTTIPAMPAILLYNTLSRSLQPLVPLRPDHVTMYVCGPTVYDYAHIGNARPVVVYDTLSRLLRRHYPRVTYVRNLTDIDDKIIAAMEAQQQSLEELTTFYTKAFHQDCAALNALPPDVEPKATDHLPEMQAMIHTLLQKGNAYEKEGNVLFKVSSMPNYGALSRREQEDMQAGARVKVADYKENASDFVLWKPSAPSFPGWESPWGHGRPGWHLECSAMIAKHLGDTIDIHGGGQDLVFPHHENEIAQTCATTGKEHLAIHWVHNGFVSVDGQKMSKSLGNFRTVQELRGQGVPGEVMRYVLLASHYRQPVDWNETALENARRNLDRLYTALRGIEFSDTSTLIDDDVETALCADLDTPAALHRLAVLAGELNKTTDKNTRAALAATLQRSGQALGLLYQEPENWFQQGVFLSEEAIQAAILARRDARTRKDFAGADKIRADLLAQGVVLEDSASGTTWRRE